MKRIAILFILCAVLFAGSSTAWGGWFGSQTDFTSLLSIENSMVAYTADDAQGMSPTGTAELDSLTFRVTVSAADPPLSFAHRLALYRHDSTVGGTAHWYSFIDSTAIQNALGSTVAVTQWYSWPTLLGATLLPTEKYLVVAWAKSGLGTIQIHYDLSASADSLFSRARTWTTKRWPNDTTFSYLGAAAEMSMYATYTLTSAGGVGRRRKILLQSHLWKEAQEGFAGEKNEIAN